MHPRPNDTPLGFHFSSSSSLSPQSDSSHRRIDIFRTRSLRPRNAHSCIGTLRLDGRLSFGIIEWKLEGSISRSRSSSDRKSQCGGAGIRRRYRGEFLLVDSEVTNTHTSTSPSPRRVVNAEEEEEERGYQSVSVAKQRQRQRQRQSRYGGADHHHHPSYRGIGGVPSGSSGPSELSWDGEFGFEELDLDLNGLPLPGSGSGLGHGLGPDVGSGPEPLLGYVTSDHDDSAEEEEEEEEEEDQDQNEGEGEGEVDERDRDRNRANSQYADLWRDPPRIQDIRTVPIDETEMESDSPESDSDTDSDSDSDSDGLQDSDDGEVDGDDEDEDEDDESDDEGGRVRKKGETAEEEATVTRSKWEICLSGKGSLKYTDGALYIGHFEDDMRHGTGKYWEGTRKSVEKYTIRGLTGSAKSRVEQKMEEEGHLEREFYNGKWEGGWRSGEGVQTYVAPDRCSLKYEGAWMRDYRHGKGRFVLERRQGSTSSDVASEGSVASTSTSGSEPSSSGASSLTSTGRKRRRGSTTEPSGPSSSYLSANSSTSSSRELDRRIRASGTGFTPSTAAVMSYFGGYSFGLKHGDGGMLNFANRDYYEGRLDNDLCDGEGKFTWHSDPVRKEYSGSFKQGAITGHGRMKFHDETTVVGFFRDGWACGKCVWKADSGNTYEGMFVNGKRQGYGTAVMYRDEPGHRVFPKKRPEVGLYVKLCGQWDDGVMTGRGMIEHHIPSKPGPIYEYVGELLEFRKHGKGKSKSLTFGPDPKHPGQTRYQATLMYNGEFRNDQRHGLGTFLCFEAAGFAWMYVGQWRHGKRHGLGFRGALKNGFRVQEGAFQNNKLHGDDCVLIDRQKRQSGQFKEGNFVTPVRRRIATAQLSRASELIEQEEGDVANPHDFGATFDEVVFPARDQSIATLRSEIAELKVTLEREKRRYEDLAHRNSVTEHSLVISRHDEKVHKERLMASFTEQRSHKQRIHSEEERLKAIQEEHSQAFAMVRGVKEEAKTLEDLNKALGDRFAETLAIRKKWARGIQRLARDARLDIEAEENEAEKEDAECSREETQRLTRLRQARASREAQQRDFS